MVYVANVIGDDAVRSASPNLRRAVARAIGEPTRSDLVETTLRQLEHELVT